MNLTQLDYFRAAAQYEHFTLASKAMNVAQPALSRQIRQLENEFGLRLFDRMGRGVRLTDAGKSLLSHVVRMLTERDTMVREMRAFLQLEGGAVALGFLHSIGAHMLPGALATFRAAYPAIEFTLHESTTQDLQDRVRRGDLDLAIVSPVPQLEHGLDGIELLRDELVVAVPPNHPLAKQREIHLSDLAREPFIFLGAKFGELRNITRDACQQAGFVPHIAFEAEGLATMRGLVGAGLGVALIPEMASHLREQAIPTPVFRPLVGRPAHRMIGIAYRPDRTLSPAAEAFKGMLIARSRPPHPDLNGYSAAHDGARDHTLGARHAIDAW